MFDSTLSRVLTIIGLGSIIGLGGFYLGYKHASDVCNTKILEIQTQAHIDEIQALQTQLEKEQGYARKIQEAQTESAQNVAQIEQKYQSAVSELNLINSNSVYSDRCSANEATLSTDTTTAAGNDKSITAGANSSRADNRKLQELYEKQLMIARDCDINQTYFKKLVELYESIRNQ